MPVFQMQKKGEKQLIDLVNSVLKKSHKCNDESEAARICLDVAEEITGSSFGFIGELNEAGKLDTIAMSDPGWAACCIEKTDVVMLVNDMPVRGIWGHVIKENSPVLTNSPSSHSASVGVPEGHPAIESFLGVPLARGDEATGIIALANKDGGYDEWDLERIMALSITFVEVLAAKRTEIKLREANENLEAIVIERTSDLRERVKEAKCRYQVSDILARNDIDIEEAAEEIVRIIPPGFQYPARTHARIMIGKKEITSEGFMESDHSITSDILFGGRQFGTIEVTISNDGGNADFLTEELKLLKSLAQSFSSFVERLESRKRMKTNHDMMIAIMDNFPEVLYVTDPETYEILKVNSEFQKLLGKDVTGKICYEEFQGLDQPCPFCTNEKLFADPENKYVWEHYNPIVDKHYTITDRLIDWPDGRKVRFEVAVDISGQKKAKEELRAEKAFVEGSIDSLPGIFFVLDREGRFQRWNRMLEEVTGFSSVEIGSKGIAELTDGDNRERISLWIDDAGEERSDIEVELLTKRGRRIPYLLNIKQFDGLDNNFLVGFGLDTTELKLAQRELQRSEARFRNLVEYTPIPVCSYNLAGELEHVNGTFTQKFGYGPQDISTLNSLWENFFPDAGYRNYAVARCNATMDDPGDECECCITSSDGSERIVDVKGISIETGTIFTFVDITRRKQYENEIRDHQRQLKLALDAQQAGIWVWDVAGDTIDLDPRSLEILGEKVSGECISLEDFRRLIKVKNRNEFDRFFSSVPVDKDENDLVVQLSADEGSVRHVRMQSLTVRDGKGEPLSMVGICLDVSKEVEGRQKLNSALSKLKVSNKELEQFAYVASHDLQEPLRMVGSYLQLLERRYGDKLDGDAKEFIHYAVDGAYRMKEMINDLLSFSRVQTRGKELEPVSSTDAVEKALTYLAPVINETSAVVDFDDLPDVQADKGQLVNLFQNLIGNGIKFNNSDAPKVRIDAIELEGEYQFSISDNGIGIEREYFDKIFVIFERLHGAGDYEGSGIGMAICKRIIERHGGRIWLDSEVGKGTTIKFTLPAAEVNVSELEQGGTE